MKKWLILLACVSFPLSLMGPGCNGGPTNEFFGNFTNIEINGDPGTSLINLELTVKDEDGNILFNETYANVAAPTQVLTDVSANFVVVIDPQVEITGAEGLPDGSLIVASIVPIAKVTPGAAIPFDNTMEPDPGDTIFAAAVIPEEGEAVMTVAYNGSIVINDFDARTLSASYSGNLNDIVVPSSDTQEKVSMPDLFDPDHYENPSAMAHFLDRVKH
ncbi:MAG: hypothetical protein D6795_19015 [Deltaproteobacteria bacterium]|nr:MAG: hypothetical protein D6795_19015 [Deltaproteobacteria bacterium]